MFRDQFPNDQESKDYTLEEKCEKFNVTESRKRIIESLRFVWNNIYDDVNCNVCRVVNVSNDLILVDSIEGISRPPYSEVNNWFEMLGHLHKKTCFDKYSSEEQFKQFVISERKDIPEVYEYQNKYYVHGEGKHRITIAKCLGLNLIRAKIYHVEY